jgi:hypothetical protein
MCLILSDIRVLRFELDLVPLMVVTIGFHGNQGPKYALFELFLWNDNFFLPNDTHFILGV